MILERRDPGGITICAAEEHHMSGVASVYARYVTAATCTFETEPPDATEMVSRYRRVRALGAPYVVATIDGNVVGYAYAGAYRDRPAYRHTLENSVYVAAEYHREGVGRKLMEQLIREATGGNFTQMVAVVGDSKNEASVLLHAKLGFERVGVLKDVGFKHGKWLDTVIMQRSLI